MIYWIAFIIWVFQTISVYMKANNNAETLFNIAKNKYSDTDNDTIKFSIYVAFVVKLFIDFVILKLFLLVL